MAERSRARWDYALALLADGRSAESLGVLEVMAQDAPDIALAGSFQLAKGRALVELRRGADAVATLQSPALAGDAEACAWRLRGLALASAHRLALQQVASARPALLRRPQQQRTPFVAAAVGAALGSGQASTADKWLRYLPPRDPGTLLLRGQVALALSRPADAADAFAGVAAHGSPEQQAAARFGSVQAGLAARRIAARAALKQLGEHRYSWRGGAIERDNLMLSFHLARALGRDDEALSSAAGLVRYHASAVPLQRLLEQSQALLASLLAPDAKTPLPRAAGLYWEYRDLAPSGPAGDLLALRLADRLQEAGLYARAAGLLEHQLFTRARDLAQGPLSVRVARLHILAGSPAKAIDALRSTAAINYPSAMRHERSRIEAVALQQLGRGGEALAVLADVPGSGALQAELLWKQRSWAALAALAKGNLPPAGALSEIRQAAVLRHAITLGMLGREGELAELRTRYSGSFAGLRSQQVFDMLTRPALAIDADQLTAAMASIPTVSPAGDYADLLDAAPLPAPRG